MASIYKDRRELAELESKVSLTAEESARMSLLAAIVEDYDYEMRVIAVEEREDRYYYEDER